MGGHSTRWLDRDSSRPRNEWLSPESRFPRAINETVAVVRWLREKGTSYGVDPDGIAVGGDSAGAAMTLSTCMMLRDAGVRSHVAVYAGATHSFLEAVSIARISDRAFDEAARWLRDALKHG